MACLVEAAGDIRGLATTFRAIGTGCDVQHNYRLCCRNPLRGFVIPISSKHKKTSQCWVFLCGVVNQIKLLRVCFLYNFLMIKKSVAPTSITLKKFNEIFYFKSEEFVPRQLFKMNLNKC